MVRRPSNEDPYPSPSQTSPSCLDSKWGIPSYLMRSPTHHIICPHILTVGMSDQAIQWRHLLIIFLCVSGNLSIPPGRSPKCVHRFETLSKILWIFFLHKSYDNFFHNYCLKEEIFINWCELIFISLYSAFPRISNTFKITTCDFCHKQMFLGYKCKVCK